MAEAPAPVQFVEAFGVWEEAQPYLHLMVDEREMQLVIAMAGQEVSAEEAGQRLGLTTEDATALLKGAHGRCIVNKRTGAGAVSYVVASFYHRLDHFAKFENWDRIPTRDRRTIDRRFLDEFIARHAGSIERKRRGLATENELPNDTVMLLSEVEAMITAAKHVVVQPCDCRRLGQYCDRPVETCIWLDDAALEALDRGHGRRLDQEEAIGLVRWADQQGLMHTADSAWSKRGLHAICNCCACDCYPFRAAQELGTKGVWPKSRYIAAYDPDECNQCGTCVKRCQFGAFSDGVSVVGSTGDARSAVVYDPDRCWGCGLCANACPSGAIQMDPLP